jgi:hypothetical protein
MGTPLCLSRERRFNKTNSDQGRGPSPAHSTGLWISPGSQCDTKRLTMLLSLLALLFGLDVAVAQWTMQAGALRVRRVSAHRSLPSAKPSRNKDVVLAGPSPFADAWRSEYTKKILFAMPSGNWGSALHDTKTGL